MAIVVKLTGVAPDEGYNLAVALILALTASAVFTVGATLWAAARGAPGAIGAGLGAVGIVVVAGNLDGARQLIADGGPLAAYDWFAPSRVIEDTITEFPWFSFLLGDLHAHLLALPFTLLALAFVLQVVLDGPRVSPRGRAVFETLGVALALGMLYTVNAWSYPVMAGLLVLGTVGWMRDGRSLAGRAAAARWLPAVIALSALIVLPFHLTFDPAAKGIGVVPDGRGFAGWLRDMALLYGCIAAPVALLFLGRVRETARPWRNVAWIAVGAAFGLSILAGLDYAHVGLLAAALLVALHALTAPALAPALRAVWLLAAGGIACLLGPEVLYVRDEFDHSDLYRMNTVFKLGYQAWVFLGLAAIGALAWRRVWLPRRGFRVLVGLVIAAGFTAAAVYPIAGTYARKDGFDRSPTLDGLGWLRDRAPGDVAAIDWLNDHARSGEVVLEAVGDDYSAFGHGRISTFTGLPTVLGWPGHELQWGHDAGSRRDDVARMYKEAGPAETLPLLRRYGIRYVVVGRLERTDYGDEGIAKWDALGHRVFDSGGTTIWELD
jgi:YYY domain-containing protein